MGFKMAACSSASFSARVSTRAKRKIPKARQRSKLLVLNMERLAARFDRGFFGFYNRFGNKMQCYRRYSYAARTFGGIVRENASGKTPEVRHCTACMKLFWSRIDSRTCSPRSFTTSPIFLVDHNENVKTKETRVKGASDKVVVEQEDFFGFEGGEGVVHVGEPGSVAEAIKKYDFLFKHEPEPSEEKVYVTSFGSLRFDRDNQPGERRTPDFMESLMREMNMAEEQQTSLSTSPIQDEFLQEAESEIRLQDETHADNFTGEQSNNLEAQLFGGAANAPEIQRLAREQPREVTGTQQTELISNLIEEQYFRSEQSEIKHVNLNESAAFGFLDVRESPIEEQYFRSDQSEIKPTNLGKKKSETATSGFPGVPESTIEEQYFPFDQSEIKLANLEQTKSESAASGFLGVRENPIEEQYFCFDEPEIKSVNLKPTKSGSAASGVANVPGSPLEEQYFGRETGLSNEITDSRQTERASGFIEEQYFRPGNTEIVQSGAENITTDSKPKRGKSFTPKVDANGNASVDMDFVNELFSESRRKSTTKSQIGAGQATVASAESSSDGWRGFEMKRFDPKTSSHETVEEIEVVEADTSRRRSNARERIKPDMENPKTAFDFAMKLRHERKIGKSSSSTGYSEEEVKVEGHGLPDQKVDSFGFRLYSDQVVDLEKEPEFMVLNMLKKSVLYNENDILALTKPYGMPVHDGAGHRHVLTKYLPELAKHFCVGYDSQELYTVHRLDKETTGVILLAKTQEMADRLNDMFAKGEVKKMYWALTKGTPSPLEGIIDIPIGEATVAGKLRMVLKPPYSEELSVFMTKSSTRAKKAVTHYKVLASHGNAALVELSPSTGVKHQLRVHLASALACPILGDHKYSHLTKLAPQKLPSDMLERLRMRQSKVRTLSMHLHARGIVVPEMVDGKNIIIGARLPHHFTQNMKRLKIRIKK